MVGVLFLYFFDDSRSFTTFFSADMYAENRFVRLPWWNIKSNFSSCTVHLESVTTPFVVLFFIYLQQAAVMTLILMSQCNKKLLLAWCCLQASNNKKQVVRGPWSVVRYNYRVFLWIKDPDPVFSRIRIRIWVTKKTGSDRIRIRIRNTGCKSYLLYNVHCTKTVCTSFFQKYLT